jgi:hypothetical protein
MMTPRTELFFALIALSLTTWGCTPDPTGEGEEGTGASDDTATGGGTVDDSTGAMACGTEDDQVMFAVDGELLPPMELGDAGVLGIQVARSGTSEMGTLTMTFATTCEGPLHLWALVWDAFGGVDPENADSLYVQVDGGEEQAWLYGCVTDGVNETWHWLPMEAWTMTQCQHDPFVVETLAAGEHSIVIRSREGGAGGIDVAAIAAVVVSHDPETDPTPFFPIPEE